MCKEKKARAIEIVLLFIVGVIVSIILNKNNYRWDSDYYYTIGDSIFANGFNFLDFPETFRGYFFPFILSMFKIIIGPEWGWRVFSALLFAFTYGLILPEFFENTYVDGNVKYMFLREMVAALIFIFYWGDFMQYPLSDMMAAVCLISGIVICKNKLVVRANEATEAQYKLILSSILAGALLYIAYNTRAAFLYAGLGVLIYTIFLIKKINKRIIVSASLVLGAIIIALPQCMINKKYVNTFSPRIYTEQYIGYEYDLQTQQLLWGLTYDRYETYGGDYADYPVPTVNFVDNTGAELFHRAQNAGITGSIKDVIKIVISHPVDMVGVYTRHLISLMTPLYNQTYIENMYTDKSLLLVTNIAIWFVWALSVIILINKKRISMENLIWCGLVLITAILQLLGAPEPRFFMPVFLLLYEWVAVKVNYNELYKEYRNKWLVTTVICIFIFIIWISLVGDILASNDQRILLIKDSSIMLMV